MKKTYETTACVNIPGLKATFLKGARLVEENGILNGNGRSAETPPEFAILLRHGIVKELTDLEASLPEKTDEPKTLVPAERRKLPVVVQDESLTRKIERKTAVPKPMSDSEIVAADNAKSVRGMKVVEPQSTQIVKSLSSKKAKALPALATPKPKKSAEELSEAKASAEKRKAERLRRAKETEEKAAKPSPSPESADRKSADTSSEKQTALPFAETQAKDEAQA